MLRLGVVGASALLVVLLGVAGAPARLGVLLGEVGASVPLGMFLFVVVHRLPVRLARPPPQAPHTRWTQLVSAVAVAVLTEGYVRVWVGAGQGRFEAARLLVDVLRLCVELVVLVLAVLVCVVLLQMNPLKLRLARALGAW